MTEKEESTTSTTKLSQQSVTTREYVFEAEIAKLHPSTFHLNDMDEETFEKLKADMHAGGLLAIDPINVSTYAAEGTGEYHIVNGSQRYEAAKQLGWKTIRAIIDTTVQNDEDALLVNYSKNRERGNVDAFAEGRLFDHLRRVRKWSNVQIAKFAHLDEKTVSRRLALAQATPQVRALVSELPGLGIQQVEKIARLEPAQQAEAVQRIKEDVGSYAKQSETDVDWITKDIREDAAKLKAVSEKIEAEKPKFPLCPKDKKPPAAISYHGWPWVACSDGKTEWNVKTNQTWRSKMAEDNAQQTRERKEKREPPKPKPTFIGTPYTPEQFAYAFAKYADTFLEKRGGMAHLDFQGIAKDGSKLEIDFSNGPNTLRLEINGVQWEIDHPMRKKEDFKSWDSDNNVIDPDDVKTRFEISPKTHNPAELAKSLKYVERLMTKYPLPKKAETRKRKK